MKLTTKCVIKQLSSSDYKQLKYLTRLSKNLANQAIYMYRQQWFTNKTLLIYNTVYDKLKYSENYIKLGTHVGQQTLKVVDQMFKSYKSLREKALKGEYEWSKVKLPKYLDKNGHFNLCMSQFPLNDGIQSREYGKTHSKIYINLPDILRDRVVKQVKIIPRNNARIFEMHVVYEKEAVDLNLNKNNALAIDLGINNLMTCVTNAGKSFIIDGRKIKSINQWYNKRNAKLQRIKDLQGYKHYTNKQLSNLRKRNNRVNDCLHKATNEVINYCIENDIGTLIVGYNKGSKKDVEMGKKTNQSFVNIPYLRILEYFKYKAKLVGIKLVKQEESYTSKASALDNDKVPKHNPKSTKKHSFSGVRVKRGLYKSRDGYLINADLNGAMNIMRKSSVVTCDFAGLYGRGELDTPKRIRVV